MTSGCSLKENNNITNHTMKLRNSILTALLFTSAARAEVIATDAWVRATVPTQKATGAFMSLKATGDYKLISATCPLTKTVEIHEMLMEGDVMKMRQIPKLDLPDNKIVSLSPGGYHVMLLDLKEQVQAGQTVQIVLLVEKSDGKRENVTVSAIVRPLKDKEP